jgi:hypothetical protein
MRKSPGIRPKSVRHYLGPGVIVMVREEACQGGATGDVGHLHSGRAEMAGRPLDGAAGAAGMRLDGVSGRNPVERDGREATPPRAPRSRSSTQH